jgi:tetratricopeptide (TPR) repeat protein
MADDSNSEKLKAQAFFQNAEKAAVSLSFDYAIEMYLEGIKNSPDDVQNGHSKLRELALLRQVKGGKKPSLVEKFKYRSGKTHLQQMLNAEYLFAKDPDNLGYAEDILKAAVAGNYVQTIIWICDFLLDTNEASTKPSVNRYILVKDSYQAIKIYDKAVYACQRAAALRPDDNDLADEVQKLAAELTVTRGKYNEQGDFRKSIKDRDKQEKMQSQGLIVKTQDVKLQAVNDARSEYLKNPTLQKNIFGFAQALAQMENDDGENTAITILEKAYKDKSDFSYKYQANLVNMQQLRRKFREAKASLEANPQNPETQSLTNGLAHKLIQAELQHFYECVENYPTDLQYKYEYAIRLMHNKEYDKAIPFFQEAQRDPKYKIPSMNKIGQCFFYKGWFADAVDLFEKTIEAYELKDDTLSKDLRYNLAMAYEHNNNIEKALDNYRKLAQIDFAFKDVREKIDNLRKKQST